MNKENINDVINPFGIPEEVYTINNEVKKTSIVINWSDKSISLTDLTDKYNIPKGYNKKVQGFRKVAEFAECWKSDLEKMTMYTVISKLDEIKDLGFRTYCAMD